MPVIISIIYAPIIVYLLKSFELTQVCVGILITTLIWFLILIIQGSKDFWYALAYMMFALLGLKLNEFAILKAFPITISLVITIIILLSYIKKNSFILYLIKRFSKKDVSADEQEYIHHCTLFWFFISLLNVGIHLMVFNQMNIQWWVWYSSIGWYVLFILAGMIQFLHRKFVFLRRCND